MDPAVAPRIMNSNGSETSTTLLGRLALFPLDQAHSLTPEIPIAILNPTGQGLAAFYVPAVC
jgi:hypothetical protein